MYSTYQTFNVGQVCGVTYAGSRLQKFASGEVCCGVHDSLATVVGRVNAMLGKRGSHPLFAAVDRGVKTVCAVDANVLRADRRFVGEVLGEEDVGRAYSRISVDGRMDKYGTGTVYGLGAFGRGYCYLKLMRPEFRFRVARVLGPAPLLGDVLVLFNAVGLYAVPVNFKFTSVGLMHCEDYRFSTGVSVLSVLSKFLEMYPQVRIGIDETGVPWYCAERDYERVTTVDGVHLNPVSTIQSLDSGQLVEIVTDVSVCARCGLAGDHGQVCTRGFPPGKGLCETCGFVVKLDGHEDRCRIQKVEPGTDIKKRLQWLGDGLHAYDVRKAVSVTVLDVSKLTQIAVRYVSGESQRNYMCNCTDVKLPEGSSDRTWANAFEERYYGEFRAKYLLWLYAQLDVDGLLNDVVYDLRKATGEDVMNIVDFAIERNSGVVDWVQIGSFIRGCLFGVIVYAIIVRYCGI